jgi:type VI protein secretion system component VasF
MVEKRKRGRPTKMAKLQEAAAARARLEAKATLNQKREGAVNLRYVAERLRDIKNMDEVEAFYKECVYNIGINTLRNGEADG